MLRTTITALVIIIGVSVVLAVIIVKTGHAPCHAHGGLDYRFGGLWFCNDGTVE